MLKLVHLRQELSSDLKGESQLFPVKNHGLRFGGPDSHPTCFTHV